VAERSHVSATGELLYKRLPKNGPPYPRGPLSVCPVCNNDIGPIVAKRLDWTDQAETWHGGMARPRHIVCYMGTQLPKEAQHPPPNFLPMAIVEFVAKRLDGSRCHFVGTREVGLGPGRLLQETLC